MLPYDSSRVNRYYLPVGKSLTYCLTCRSVLERLIIRRHEHRPVDYQEVVKKESVDASMTDYAAAYAAMDPKDAAEIFNTMGSSLELVGKILNAMNSAQRGAILGEMDPDMAAQVTRIMDPD